MIVLASASPRRKDLLRMLTDDFIVDASGVDEAVEIAKPDEKVLYLAQLKAEDVAARHPKDTVIGADTLVYAAGEILEKPVDIADARRMIRILSGIVHKVYTGVCLVKEGAVQKEICVTDVHMDVWSEAEIEEYLQTEQVLDKAGAYGIQSMAAKFVNRINGCYYNAMGLPLNLLYNMLKRI